MINLFGKKGLWLASIFLGLILLFPQISQAEAKNVTFLYKDNCQYCQAEEIFLESLSERYELRINRIDINNPSQQEEYLSLVNKYGFPYGFTPVTIANDQFYLGFNTAEDSGVQIDKMIQGQEPVRASADLGCSADETTCANEEYNLPLFGKVNLDKLSLPALTVIIGFADGFNPCAMWALIALLGFLLSLKCRRKLLIVGGAFLLASFASSFLFIAMWYGIFNVLNDWLLLLGTSWVKYFEVAVGLLALGIAIRLLIDFVQKKNLECGVVEQDKKRAITQKLKTVAQDKRILVAVFGAIILAVGVNIIEAMCSVGLPVVYTSILNSHNLNLTSALMYIFSYNVFYMADDILVFTVIVLTNKVLFASPKIGRVAKLILAIILLVTAYNLFI